MEPAETVSRSLAKAGRERECSLFHYMSMFDWQSLVRDELQDIKVPRDDSKAFILRLNPNKAVNVASGCTVLDCHITIYLRFFIPSTNPESIAARGHIKPRDFLTHWHYTQREEKDGKVIEYHKYFHYLEEKSCHMRIAGGPNLPITNSSYIERLRRNFEPAIDVMIKLINATIYKRDEYTQTLDRLYSQHFDHKQMTKMSTRDLAKFLSTCEEVSNVLNKLTEDEVDNRIETIRRNIDRYRLAKQRRTPLSLEHMKTNEATTTTTETEETLVASLETTVETALAVEESTKQNDLPTSSTLSTKKKPSTAKIDYQKMLSELRKRCNKLIKSYQACKDVGLVKLSQEKEDLFTEITILLMECNDSRIEADAEKLADELQKLPNIVEIAIDYAFKGQSSKFIELFPHIIHLIPRTFYMDLLTSVIAPDTHGDDNKYCELFEFLYENSDVYKAAVLNIPRLVRGDALDKQYPVAQSLLWTLANDQRAKLFKLIVQQTNQVNTFGFKIGKEEVSLITAVARLDQRGEMLACLLDMGATHELPQNWFKHASLSDRRKRDSLLFSEKLKTNVYSTFHNEQMKKVYTSLLATSKAFACIRSPFFAYCHNEFANWKLMQQLATGATDVNLMLGFASMLFYCSSPNIPTNGDDLYAVFPEMELHQRAMAAVQDDEVLNATNIKHYILAKRANIRDAINVVVAEVKKRMSACDDIAKGKMIREALNMADERLNERNYRLAGIIFHAAIHIAKHKTPTAATHQEIIDLSDKVLDAYRADPDISPELKAKSIRVISREFSIFKQYSKFASRLVAAAELTTVPSTTMAKPALR